MAQLLAKLTMITFGLVSETGEVKLGTLFAQFASDECGATAIEYGLIAALISVAIVAALAAVGGQLNTLFNTVVTDLTPAS